MNIRGRLAAICLTTVAVSVPGGFALAGQASAAYQTLYYNFTGSGGATGGGRLGVGNNPYNYPQAAIDTPAFGYNQCFATVATINWGNNQTTFSPQGGANALAYGAQGSPANYGLFQACPAVYNCSGDIGPFYP